MHVKNDDVERSESSSSSKKKTKTRMKAEVETSKLSFTFKREDHHEEEEIEKNMKEFSSAKSATFSRVRFRDKQVSLARRAKKTI